MSNSTSTNVAIVNTQAFTNVTLRFPNLATPRGFQNQKETYSVTAYFDQKTNEKLKKAGFKVKEPRINPVTNEKEFSMEIRSDAMSGHQPPVFNSEGNKIDPSQIGNGTIANLKVVVRTDNRNPDKLVTTLMAVKALEIVAPVSSVTEEMISQADNCDF